MPTPLPRSRRQTLRWPQLLGVFLICLHHSAGQSAELGRSIESHFTMENPYSAPQATNLAAEIAIQTPRHYGGIRRLPYLGIIIGLTIVQNWLLIEIERLNLTGAEMLMVSVLILVVSFIPVYYRLMNIGMNPWWCLLMLVPIANLLIAIRCFVFQEGYADTKKLDLAGRVITYIVLGSFILIIVALVIAVIVS